MHLGDGVVTTECAMAGMAVGTVGVGVAGMMLRRAPKPKPMHFGGAIALAFAMQMFNVPVFSGASGHVIGGFLLAYWFGPAWATLGMAALLAAETVLFADGGVMALGLNVTTMAVVPCLVVEPIWRRLARGLSGGAGWGAIAGGAWASVMLAATGCSLALLSRAEVRESAGSWLATMMGVHALIGLVEAAATVAAIAVVAAVAKREAFDVRWRGIGGTAAIAGVAIAAFYGASPWPDGLEFSLERLGVEAMATGWVEWLAAWQQSTAPWPDYGMLLGALAGCAALAGLGWAAARVARGEVRHA